MKKERLEKVIKKLEERNIYQAIFSDPKAILYLTGTYLEPGERFYGLYINTDKECYWFINNLFQKPNEDYAKIIFHSDVDDPIEGVEKVLHKDKNLGVDKTFQAKFLLPIINRKLVSNVEVASLCIDELRACKDEEEIKLMRESSRVNDCAMEKFRELIKPGVSERQVASQMLEIYRSMGAQEYSFDPIVSFGVNTAITHHSPDDTVIKEGDIVLLDVGCKKDWYCSDMTRVFFYKHQPTKEEKEIYEVCRKATETAESICGPNVPLWQIDKAARDVIKNAGYGNYFLHRTGHFIGLEDHDYGDVSSSNQNLTKPGNIFSIEPGICIDNHIQMYIEDLVLITQDGKEVLNHYSHDISIIE